MSRQPRGEQRMALPAPPSRRMQGDEVEVPRRRAGLSRDNRLGEHREISGCLQGPSCPFLFPSFSQASRKAAGQPARQSATAMTAVHGTHPRPAPDADARLVAVSSPIPRCPRRPPACPQPAYIGHSGGK